MALKGTLKDFGLSDIFQLIAHQRKTGVLYLEDRGKSVAVTFEDGKIVSAEPGSSATEEKEKIGAILVKSGLLDSAQLESALEEQTRTMRLLGVVLQDKQYLTAEQFQTVFTFQIKETLFKIFQWTTGNYRFEAGNVSYDQKYIAPLSAEYVLMEAARIIDEWPGIKVKIPSMDMVFAHVPGVEEKIFRRSEMEQEALEDDGAGIDVFGETKPKSYDGDRVLLTTEQEKVLDLMDGELSVSDLAYRTLLGDFETARALVDLLGYGLVKPVKVPVSTPRSVEQEEKARGGRRLLTLVLTFALVGGLLFIAFSTLSLSGYRFLIFSQMTSEKAVMIRNSVSQAQIDRLDLAARVYRLERGSYPMEGQDLVQGEYILPSDVSYPFAQQYKMELTSKGFNFVNPEE
jgi:hypothetical protein